MVHKSLASLRLDQRLIRRRGWIDADELEKALGDLPDVSDKVAAPSSEADEASGSGAGPAGDEGETP